MNPEPPKNGFKTFLITIAVSLLVFSTLYFVITDSQTEDIEPEAKPTEVSNVQKEETTQQVESSVEKPVAQPETTTEVEGDADVTEESVFGAYTENSEEVKTTTETAAEAAAKEKAAKMEASKMAAVETPKEEEKVLGTKTVEKTTAPEAPVDSSTMSKETIKKEEAPEVLASAEVVPVGSPQVNQVLGGADVEESTVPQTGSTKITVALLLSAVLLSIWGYLMSRNPNKMALEAFERKVTKDLD